MRHIHALSSAADNRHRRSQRRGVLTLWSVFGLLAAGLCTALVINQLWLSAVRSDALRCAEASALAAGHGLLSDDMLRLKQNNFEQEGRTDRSLNDAVQMSRRYHQISTAPILRRDDVRHRRRHDPAKSSAAVVSTADPQQPAIPDSIVVTYGTAEQGFRIPLFFSGATGVRDAAMGVSATAALEHHPVGFSPGATSIPMLPFAAPDDEGQAGASTWTQMIEQAKGFDRYSWNPERQTVQSGPDGLPEIVLTVRPDIPATLSGNLIPMGFAQPASGSSDLNRQIERGITSNDLGDFPGTGFRFPCSFPAAAISAQGLSQVADSVGLITGQPRILCLCQVQPSDSSQNADSTGTPSEGELSDGSPTRRNVRLTRPVAARVVHVAMRQPGYFEVTLQPCVLVTSTAIMDRTIASAQNRYVYSVRLIQ